MANIPLIAGAAIGAAGMAAKLAVDAITEKPERTKEELKREKIDADVLFVVRPETALQRAVVNATKTLFF